MRRLSGIRAQVLVLLVSATSTMGADLNDHFQGISTLVVGQGPLGLVQATGFFYQELAPPDPTKTGPQWRAVKRVWLVTNRHVIFPSSQGRETLVEALLFHLRRRNGTTLEWEPILLERTELLKRARFHQSPDVDVALIDVLDLMTAKLKSGGEYLPWYGISEENLPGRNKITVEVSDDVVVIGYPRNYYDQVNLYPIVKGGIVASRWGAPFGGRPLFLIDAKLFPGSSGSIVISKPTHVAFEAGRMFSSEQKQFAFLGIFSGEPFAESPPVELETLIIREKVGFNLGVVWYGRLIPEIIAEGVPYVPSK